MTPEDKALCEALRLDYLNQEALEAATRIEALSAENEELKRGHWRREGEDHEHPCYYGHLCPGCEVERLKAELAAEQIKPKAFCPYDMRHACGGCADHDREIHRLRAEVERLKSENERLSEHPVVGIALDDCQRAEADLKAEREAHAKTKAALLAWQMGEGDTEMEKERDALRAVLVGLRPIAESMRGQDNRATSHPMYVVETKTGRMGQYDFVTAFFSEREADAYVLANAHNLKKPRVFVYSANRNREWQAVRACLLALAASRFVDRMEREGIIRRDFQHKFGGFLPGSKV